MEIMTSRLLDSRKTLVIGLSLVAGLAVEVYPVLVRGSASGLQAVLGTSLVLGTLVGLALNLLFRIGIRRTGTLTVPLDSFDPESLDQFLERQGAAWGARRDVIERARFNLVQSIETILAGCDPQGPLRVDATFDEFNLDIRVSYPGAPLALPATRPTNEEIMASEAGQHALAGFLLRRFADRVQCTHVAGHSSILFHFEH